MAQRCTVSYLYTILCCLLLTLGGCSTHMTLTHTDVQVSETASLGRPAVFFLDKVLVPVREGKRIGKIRAIANGQWKWVTTESDLSLWAENEWSFFLQRHGQTMVTNDDVCDYTILCDILKIQVEKFNEYSGAHKFAAEVALRINIQRHIDGVTVFAKDLGQSYGVVVPIEGLESAGDEAIYNHCLAMAMQKCLEKIVLEQPLAR